MKFDRGVSVKEQLYELENKLLQMEIRNSAEALKQLLANDFVEYGRSGRIYDKNQIVEGLPNDQHMLIEIKAFQVKKLAEDVALVTYQSVRKVDKPVHSLRSSIWKQISGRWQMIFHQGTPMDAKGENEMGRTRFDKRPSEIITMRFKRLMRSFSSSFMKGKRRREGNVLSRRRSF